MTAVISARRSPLSPRQRQVLELVAAGRSGREIAMELCVAPSTVSGYLGDIYFALGVHGAPEAVAVGYQLGLLAGGNPAVLRGGLREVLELVLARDFEGAYSMAVEVVARIIAAERQDAASAGPGAEAAS